ncbi:TMAO reductase system periplasmic protein TorT [Photobacterium lutimaris]|uniref:TMAO reductase system periplasmic protein TorT n=1 Tax=Photobacterium lutimaris TaxID=388278 RepID=A0A2T3IL37_9GAMM|nr:TMAO reductase system periplasmic protein TorT [Photobacterium lutimaris]PSU29050.1 TMAO reductase system periplasmic protein TorT [Photobacterium lutimaris]TDR75656.1 monosaccharide ABC transporter substrate-binding protein (CUT2 family) [Photobacterium lutimaris]
MIKTIAITLLAVAGISQTAHAVEVIAYTPPFEASKQAQAIEYQPLEKASKPWKLCAVYPHLKDSYWLSVNYGMVGHAKKLGVELKVLESGGYPNLDKQQSQLTDCREWDADAIILGTVDSLAYENRLTQLTDDIPIFATINYLDTSTQDSHDNVIARVGIDWYEMGYRTGEFLAKRHPNGSGMVNVALLPGPQKRGGTKPVVQGFYDATAGSDINIVTTLWADHSKELQRNLIQQLLASEQHFDYIVGGAVSAEVAISELRAKHLSNDTKILSTYLSHGVYRGLLRGKILFAPSDKMAQQAMLSVDQAVRYLEGKPLNKDLAPILALLTPDNLDSNVIAESLSPAEFRPVFHVEAPQYQSQQ